jgi:WSC domain
MLNHTASLGASILPLNTILGGVELLVDSPLIVGCYLIASASLSFANYSTTTLHDCLIQCGVGNIAAVTNGVNCVCFSAFPHDVLIPSPQGCVTNCPGNSNTICGGPAAYTIATACKKTTIFVGNVWYALDYDIFCLCMYAIITLHP